MRVLLILLLVFHSGICYADGNWNGKACAFTFSSDDGYDCNMDWKIIFDRFGYHFTIFTNPLTSELSVARLNILHTAGHEIASHSMTHRHLIRNTAFTLQYVGVADWAGMRILDDTLYLYSEKADENHRIGLTDSFCQYLVDLVSYIDSLPSYSCTLDYYPHRYWPCASGYLIETDWCDIKTQPYQALTEAGSNMEQLLYEVCAAKRWLDSVITDTTYECKTFAWPYNEHDLREMIVVRDSAEHIAARNGSPVGRPFGTNSNSTWDTISLYELQQGPGSGFLCGNNSFTEEQTRNTIRNYIEEWKQSSRWSVIGTHTTVNNIDTLHMKWILDEIQQDGDVWVETFATIAEYVRQTHYPCNGWDWIPSPGVEVKPPLSEPEIKICVISGLICYSLPEILKIKLLLYDIAGRLVKVLESGERNAGQHQVTLPLLAKGVYFVILKACGEPCPERSRRGSRTNGIHRITKKFVAIGR